MAIFWEKLTIVCNFSEKNVKFLAIFGQSNGNFPEGQKPVNGSPLDEQQLTKDGTEEILVRRKPEHVSSDDFPAVVVRVKVICILFIFNVVSSKVTFQHAGL